jgi:aspartate/methionine/tyrosine aminotransferase
VGLKPNHPKGAYFLLADFTEVFKGDDLGFAKHLVSKVGVAAIPPSSFYPQTPEEGRRLVRFAFCKSLKTLNAAIERLQKLR